MRCKVHALEFDAVSSSLKWQNLLKKPCIYLFYYNSGFYLLKKILHFIGICFETDQNNKLIVLTLKIKHGVEVFQKVAKCFFGHN